MSALNGYKTYIGLGVGAVVLVAHSAGVPLPPGITVDDGQLLNNLWLIGVAAAARHAVSKVETSIKSASAPQ